MMNDKDLTGKLEEKQVVIEVTHGYMGTSYRKGRVEKVTKTRVKVSFPRDGQDRYTQEYTLKTGRSYPSRSDYHYTNIVPMDDEISEKYDAWVKRKKLTSRAYKLLDEIGHIPREIDRMTTIQLAALVDGLERVNDQVQAAKNQPKVEDR